MGNSKRRRPPERSTTPNQAILSALKSEPQTALELSSSAGVSEKDVYDIMSMLIHLKKNKVQILPAQCVACGYRFVKRDKAGKPGKCPVCRERRIAPPRFYRKG